MASEPDLILAGFGATDDLQITVAVERLLARRGRALVLAPGPNLRNLLQSRKVDWTDLTDRFADGRPFAEAYLDVADAVLRECAAAPPAILLTQGNPLFLNSLNRYLVREAGDRGLTVRTHAGVSPMDMAIDYLGLDVGTHGLQMFDAGRMVAREQGVDPVVTRAIP